MVCVYGHGIVRGIFEENKSSKLKGFEIWLPMMKDDNIEAARTKSAKFQDARVSHFWDADFHFGDLAAKKLQLQKTAWDTYLLYDQGIRWEDEFLPEPSFWMAQLPSDWGMDNNHFLDPGRMAEKVHKLMGTKDTRKWLDLKLQFHACGLFETQQKDINVQAFLNEVESSGF